MAWAKWFVALIGVEFKLLKVQAIGLKLSLFY